MLTLYLVTEGEAHSRDTIAEALIARMSKGEMSAMGDLYELIKKDVYAYALSKTANRENAEDVVHDTFVQVWKNATQYRPMGKPLAWIFTIETNLIYRQYNENKATVPLDDAIEVETERDDFSDGVIDNEFLSEMMITLSDEEREIIALHIVSGLKHREVAKLLGKPLSTVLSRYNRAIKKLQAQIKEET